MSRLEQLRRRGWDVLRLVSDEISLEVVPGIGGTIISLTRLTDGAELLGTPRWGLRHAGAYAVPGSAEATMLDSWPGGWQTLFPNAGDATAAHGVELGYDGEARIAWLDWDFNDPSLVLTGRLTRSPFELSRTISVSGPEVRISESVRNLGAEAIEVMWGNQLTFGADLLGSDTVIDAAATVVHPDPSVSFNSNYDDITPWPRAPGAHSMINLRSIPRPDAGVTRLAYLTEFTRPSITITRPSENLRIDLAWDQSAWPHVWYSLEAGERRGYPWFRSGYFLALTPCSSWPAHGVHEARRVSSTAVWIEPDAVHTSSLTAVVSSS